jgi:hypothetical protein
MHLRVIALFIKKITAIENIGAGTATGYGLDDRGAGVRVLEGQEFSLLHVVQADFGAHPASYPLGTAGPFPVDKAAGA